MGQQALAGPPHVGRHSLRSGLRHAPHDQHRPLSEGELPLARGAASTIAGRTDIAQLVSKIGIYIQLGACRSANSVADTASVHLQRRPRHRHLRPSVSSCDAVLTSAVIVAKLMGKRQGFSQWTDNLLVRLATVVFGSSALTCGGAIVLAVLCLLPTGNVAALWVHRARRSASDTAAAAPRLQLDPAHVRSVRAVRAQRASSTSPQTSDVGQNRDLVRLRPCRRPDSSPDRRPPWRLVHGQTSIRESSCLRHPR